MSPTISKESANGGTSEMNFKRADRRSSINILVLGDEGVGKSSLISTFVSRYFSEVVPGIMTRVRLPPDPDTGCITTIVDSQGADAALISAVAALSLGGGVGGGGGGATLGGSSASLMGLMEGSQAQQQHPMTTNTTQPAEPLKASEQQKSTPAASATAPATSTPFTSRTTPPLTNTNTTPGIDNIDSIILVYDLDRVETFFRLENHWLPLIERCYDGKIPVIVAENKMDLFRPSSSAGMTDEQALARKRQQIVSLMQRFPFVRQCIKCSARNLLRVDDVFLKAQQAVIYPFTPPLYDLETGRLTVECKRAFTRIFRMYDRDHDSLLSDSELDRFQRETYHVATFDRDFAAWKKVVTRNNPTDEAVLRDGKFTVAGFIAIFDVFISQNRLDVVWQALRKFGYDDDLNLHVPDDVVNPTDDDLASSWRLTISAKRFLAATFHHFDSDKDGRLSPTDIVSIFSIFPPAGLPPWHPLRAPELFEGCFTLPKESPISLGGRSASSSSGDLAKVPSINATVDDTLIVPPAEPTATVAMTHSLSASGISLLSASDSLPSVDVGGMHPLTKPLNFLEWMGHWHAVAAISPAICRSELFRLGHVEESYSSRRRQARSAAVITPMDAIYESTIRSREIRVLVLGSTGSGKTALLNALCGVFEEYGVRATDTISTTRPETSATFVKFKRKVTSGNSSGGKNAEEQGEEFVVHLVFTEVPDSTLSSQEEKYRELSGLFGSTASSKDRVYDLAMLVFDCTNMASWAYVKEMESSLLTKETPRVFVATKSDLLQTPEPRDLDALPATVLDVADIHCRETELEIPFRTSAANNTHTTSPEARYRALDHLTRCTLRESGIERLKSRPHEEQKRREAARRRMWFYYGGIVTVGVVVAVGVRLLLGTPSSKNDHRKSSISWFRSWFVNESSQAASPAEIIKTQ